jgi:flagellar assembly protein FliH
VVKNLSKVISGDEPNSFQRWIQPEVSTMKNTAHNLSSNTMISNAGQVEKIRKQAYQEGFQQGQRDGITAGQEEYKSKSQSLDRIIKTFKTPLADLDEEVINELVTLATTIARHLIRRELKADPGEIVGVVREALSSLPVATHNLSIYLHPEDVTLVREALSLSGDGESYKLIDDPAITRGGCRVITDTSQVDATIEKRLATLVTQLMGGERESDGNT